MNRDHASLGTRRRVEAAWVVVILAAMTFGYGLGYLHGSDLPAGAYGIVPSDVATFAVDRLERGAACRCADRSVTP
jgi:hypothetical protein